MDKVVINEINTSNGSRYDLSRFKLMAKDKDEALGEILINILNRLDQLEDNLNVT